MREIFRLDSLRLGTGTVKFSCSHDASVLSAYGVNGFLSIFNVHGELIDQVVLPETNDSEGKIQSEACLCETKIFCILNVTAFCRYGLVQ